MSELPTVSATALAVEDPSDERAAQSGGAPADDSASALATVLALATAAVALGAIYADTFAELVQVWEVDPNYSHGFMVPVASLAFAWLAWRSFGSPVRRWAGLGSTVKGTAEVLFGLALHVPAWLLENWLIDVLSLICVLRGVLLILGGAPANRAYGFAALFLIFMAPLPIAWYQPIAIAMQQLVSGVSTEFLAIVGVPAYREGYFIHLPGYTMEVGEACSGLRQLTAILALSVAIGHLGQRGMVYRWTLAILAIPIAIFANCVRVMLTGVVSIVFGPKWAEGVFHTLEGLVIVGLAAVMVVGAAWGLTKIEHWYKRGEESSGSA